MERRKYSDYDGSIIENTCASRINLHTSEIKIMMTILHANQIRCQEVKKVEILKKIISS